MTRFIRSYIRHTVIDIVGRLFDLSKFETIFAYALFLSRVLALVVNTMI